MTERAPEDDFDEVDAQLRGRRGAHRQAPRRLASVLPVVGVLGAVVAVGWAVTAATGLTGGQDAVGTGTESAAVSTPQVPASEATTAPGSTDPSSDPATDPATGGEEGGASSDPGSIFSSPASSEPAEASETPSSAPSSPSASSSSASSSAPAAVDEDVDVVVLNATRTSGLAASTAADLEADGWTVASTGNERDVQPATTVVLFPSADLEATAVAVAGDLGAKVIARLDEGAAAGSVTVLVGADRVR